MNESLDEKCKTCIFYKLCDSCKLPHCGGDAYYQEDVKEGEK